jgi:hypothetical protein
VEVVGRPEHDCLASIDLEGNISLLNGTRARVEGLTPPEAQAVLAETLGLSATEVLIQLVESRSARIILRGPERNRQRIMDFRPGERVTELLERSQVKLTETNVRDVSVIRPNIAAGGRPEVFHIDFLAISQGDRTSDVELRSSDIVFVGETRRSSFARMLPSWAVPIYQKILAILPPPGWIWLGRPHPGGR